MFRTAICKLPTRRPFHTDSIVWEEWTKASLRRMKKPELTRLAKENNLKTAGTKNDIIIQLLTHQTAKIVGSTTPASQTIEKVIHQEEPKEEEKKKETTPKEEDDFEADSGWMNAFEMKVAQRGSRKPVDPKRDRFTSKTVVSKPHPFNDQLKASTLLQPAEDKPKPTFSAPAVPGVSTTKQPSTPNKFESKTVTTAEEIEGMDPQWVEAFDLKVGSRGARHQFKDTLSPTTNTTSTSALGEVEDALEFIKIDTKKAVEDKVKQVEKTVKKEVGKKFVHVKKRIEKHGNKHYHNDSQTQKEKEEGHSGINKVNIGSSSTKSETADTSNNDATISSREKLINATVGSSMFVWYYSEGLSKIWHFLSSSS